MMYTEYESLAGNMTFTEENKTRYNQINDITQELNKEIHAELRKYQSIGIAGIDLSASSYFTQAVYAGIVIGLVVFVLFFMIKLLFTKKQTLAEQMKEEKWRKK